MDSQPTNTQQAVILEKLKNLTEKIDSFEKKVDSINNKLDQQYISRLEFLAYKAEMERRIASLEDSRKWIAYTIIGVVIVGIIGYFFAFSKGTK